MAREEVIDFLNKCPSPEKGCFASDPDALEDLIDMDDVIIRADLESAAASATDAGKVGIPARDVMYHPATLTVINESTDGTFSPTLLRGEVLILDEEVPAIAPGQENSLRARVTRCANACGATAIGCPFNRTPDHKLTQ